VMTQVPFRGSRLNSDNVMVLNGLESLEVSVMHGGC